MIWGLLQTTGGKVYRNEGEMGQPRQQFMTTTGTATSIDSCIETTNVFYCSGYTASTDFWNLQKRLNVQETWHSLNREGTHYSSLGDAMITSMCCTRASVTNIQPFYAN